MRVARFAEPGIDITTKPQFLPIEGSVKLRCSICGDVGYDVSAWSNPRSWMNRCRAGHFACPDCGRVLKLTRTGKRQRHSPCPARQSVAGASDTPSEIRRSPTHEGS